MTVAPAAELIRLDDASIIELCLGGVMAVTIPSALSLLWGRLWRAGLISGVALAVLLHVTLAVAALTGLYQLVERTPRTDPRAAR